MNKFLALCCITFLLFSCQNETISTPLENISEKNSPLLSGEILTENEKNTQIEKEFEQELNELLHTIENQTDESTNNSNHQR